MACCLLGVSQEVQSWGSISVGKRYALDAGVGGGRSWRRWLKGMKLELNSEGKNRISHMKTEGRHFGQRE